MKRILAGPLLALALLPLGSIADDQDVIDYRRHIMETLDAQVRALGMIMSGAIPDDNVVAHIDIIAQTAATALKAFEPKVEGGDSQARGLVGLGRFLGAHERVRRADGDDGEDRAREGQGRGAAAGGRRADLQAVPRRLPGQEARKPNRRACGSLVDCSSRRSPACALADEPLRPPRQRGRYVATAANCISCHTREGGAAYAGGRPLATPLGTIHSTNITPGRRDRHRAPGRAQDLKRALREGIAADGRHLFPAFPYPFYTRLSDRDIADLYAYLRTLKPVRYIPPDNDPAFSRALADGDVECAEPRCRRVPAGSDAIG